MPTHYPTDRFDRLPDDLARVGAHRGPERRGRGWIGFAWAALATGVLVASGILFLTAVGNSINLPFADSVGGSEPEPLPSETAQEEEVAPLLDSEVPITVVNGTDAAGLAAQVGEVLVAVGWCGATGTTAPEDGPCEGISALGARVNAQSPVETTIVYYDDLGREAAARAVVESLGIGTIVLSDDYPGSPITVVIGPDYSPPADAPR